MLKDYFENMLDSSEKNTGGENVINIEEGRKRVKEGKQLRRITDILEEELPKREGYLDFGLGVTREEIIRQLINIFADTKALGIEFLDSMRKQLLIDASLDMELRKRIIFGLGKVINKCRREFTTHQYGTDQDDDKGI